MWSSPPPQSCHRCKARPAVNQKEVKVTEQRGQGRVCTGCLLGSSPEGCAATHTQEPPVCFLSLYLCLSGTMREGRDTEGGCEELWSRGEGGSCSSRGLFLSASEEKAPETKALCASTSLTTYTLDFKTPECHKANTDHRSGTLASLEEMGEGQEGSL